MGLSWKIVGKIPALSIPFLSHNFCTVLCGDFGDLAGFICSVILLSAGSWPVLVFFMEEHGQSGVKQWCLNTGRPCLLTWDKTQRKVRFSWHWSVDRHFEALRGASKMLQPTTGVAGAISMFHSSAWFLGFLLCIPLLLRYCSSLVSVFHLFFFCFFFFGLLIVWDFLKAIIGIFAFCTMTHRW